MTVMTDDERYAAIRARDTRFDGMFFTCVRSTGIFCRPSCPARTPQRGGVEFVPSAAAALAGGYRACKRCGPTAPPGSPDDDPQGSLSGRALRLIDAGALDEEGTVPALARRLAVSERTLHRALIAATGAGALAHARLRRARRARELVVGSQLPLARIAHAAGFGSERQFHETFTEVFGHAPSVVRERIQAPRAPDGESESSVPAADDVAVVTARLAVRRPFDGPGLAAWFAHRAVPGVEDVTGLLWTRAVQLPHGAGVVQVDLGADGALPVTMRLTDLRDHAAAIALVRRLLDLDADPVGIDAGLASALPALAPLLTARPGVRLPGTPSLAEALLWAITGQQITTAQAREQIGRATDLLAAALPAPLHLAGVHRTPVDPVAAAAAAPQWFRGPRARRETLVSAVPAIAEDEQGLPLAGSIDELRERLLALRGIGPWTADYALLRGVRAVDVAPDRDVALLGAARDLGLAEDHASLRRALEAASPWRSYAAAHLWQHRATLRAAAGTRDLGSAR
ncbi:MAG: helix-turn-helix domain-containing protein [Brachybacterium sp.]|uniref:DNA-3-methyladenine glycosylase 2 family protein n=1 Tax=Brachybacterium sp. TaxID=1891286 RepID=UPI0026484F46|nr:Ada metal-binding domain-containing protein [Brachybacterium sp.]MDN5686823.1 helix-turn-helix domain-containing protein [Brachybacterium sp.]